MTQRLGLSDHRRLSGDVGVIVDDPDPSEGGHRGGHVRLRDGVHRRGDAGDGEGHAPAEARGERDGVGGEVDVVREEDDVVVGVGVSLRKELLRREPIFERRHLEGRERERRGRLGFKLGLLGRFV